MRNLTENRNRELLGRRNSWAGEIAVVEPTVSTNRSIKSSISSTSSGSRGRTSVKHSASSKTCSSTLHSFAKRYQELCEYYQVIPMAVVRANLPWKCLHFSADNCKERDWKPILNALSTDKELHTISVKSCYPRKVVKCENSLQNVAHAFKFPVLFTHFYFNGLIDSLVQCLTINECLTCLELVGMPLSPKYLSQLMEGISKSNSLQHLSLEESPIGDDGVEELCKALQTLPRITTLNVSVCGLTPVGAGFIANLIKIQKMNRFLETWQRSLRYQNPNLDSMWGLRRIMLNSNPTIGDKGAKTIAEVLEDDLWVKAIDMQKCGIGKDGASAFVSLLHSNCVIAIIDIRNNGNVPLVFMKELMSLLKENNKDRVPEYHWIDSRPARHRSLMWLNSFERVQKNGKVNGKFVNESSSHSALQIRRGISKCKERPSTSPAKGYDCNLCQV